MNRRRFCVAIGGAASLMSGRVLGASDSLRSDGEVRCFGTTVRIVVHGVNRPLAEKAIGNAFDELSRIEKVMSIYLPDSQLSQLNRMGVLPDPDPMLVQILRRAHEFSIDTDSAFDVTVQSLWDLFSTAKKNQLIPDAQAILETKRRVGFRNVIVEDNVIELKRNAAVTLNGIAQGFATDRAKQVLLDHGIEHALLDIGELSGLGEKNVGQDWKAGIQHPRYDECYSAVVAIGDRCLATSGDYQTRFSKDYRFHHIFDPLTGRSPTELSSVSVLAPTATEADALSTALMVMGVERGAKCLERKSHVDALFIRKNGSTLATARFPRGDGR